MSLIIQDEYVFQFQVHVKTPTLSDEPRKPYLSDATSDANTDTFVVTARAVSELTIKQLIEGISSKDVDLKLCEELIIGWEEIFDREQQLIPFTKENLRKIVAFPFIRNAILSSYWSALYESRLKN